MSSSSTECECDVYRVYTPIQPLYSDLRHPMVYHTQVQRKQGNRKNDINKNCFVKAFRWYTQEHVPLNKVVSNTNNQDFHGFASWLDEKYEEYVRCNRKGNQSSQCLKKPNSVQTTSPTDNVSRKQLVLRRHKLKSPWRRRRKCFNKQDVDTLKADKSIEIILKPKNLSRSTSECCQKCNRSNNTMTIELNTPSNMQSKSENVIYVVNEKEFCNILTDDKTTLEEMRTVDKINESKRQTRMKIPASPRNDVSCQCSNITFEKVNVSSQFSHTDKMNVCECVEIKVPNQQTVAGCPCTESYTKFITISKEEPSMILKAAASSTTSQKSLPMSSIINIIEPRKTSFSNKINIEKNVSPFTVGKVSQTSDHAINLADGMHPVHPIFLRIVCPDKLTL